MVVGGGVQLEYNRVVDVACYRTSTGCMAASYEYIRIGLCLLSSWPDSDGLRAANWRTWRLY